MIGDCALCDHTGDVGKCDCCKVLTCKTCCCQCCHLANEYDEEETLPENACLAKICGGHKHCDNCDKELCDKTNRACWQCTDTYCCWVCAKCCPYDGLTCSMFSNCTYSTRHMSRFEAYTDTPKEKYSRYHITCIVDGEVFPTKYQICISWGIVCMRLGFSKAIQHLIMMHIFGDQAKFPKKISTGNKKRKIKE